MRHTKLLHNKERHVPKNNSGIGNKMFYVGQTQQQLKNQNYKCSNDVKIHNSGKKFEAYLAHMTTHHQAGKETNSTSQAYNFSTTKVVWQGKAISCMNFFGKLKCHLCMQEQLEILNDQQ